MVKKKFYITTAIDYVNSRPHIGHAYEKILADAVARWHRLKGEKVRFLTGTDENAQKNVQVAKEEGIAVKEFVDRNSKIFIELCKKLNISYDDFIRTTEKRHVKKSQEIFKRVYDKGEIYKGRYEGLYCEGCESFITEKELVNGKCPEHNKKPKSISEEAYFFRLSKYKDKILRLLKEGFVIPKARSNEIITRLKDEGLKDLCVSRTNLDWGIDSPIDKKFKIYVWFDALINYVSGADGFWPADYHVIGKGINWFHSVIWPAMLMSAGYELPKNVWVHCYLTVNGKKISKSLGNVIDPIRLCEKYPVDSLRYFLIREVPFGQDGDFSEESIKKRLNNELANDLGNLVSRVLTLIEKNFKNSLKKIKIDKRLSSKLNLKKIDSYMKKLELHNALSEIWKFVNECNKHINQEKLWAMKGKELEKHLYTVTEAIRIIAILLSSFLPETSGKIFSQLRQKCESLDEAEFGLIKEYKVKKTKILFKKI